MQATPTTRRRPLHVHVYMYEDDTLECTGGAREYTMDEDDVEDIDYYEF